GVVGLSVASLPLAQRGQAPAAVGALEGPQRPDGRRFLIGVHEAVEPCRGPEKHGLMVHVGRRSLAKIAAQPLQTTLGEGAPDIIAGGMAHAKRRDDGSVVIVMLERG